MSTVPFKSRQGWLSFFGIVEIVFGLAAGAMALLVAATLLIPKPEGAAVPPRTVLAAVPLYLAISAVLLILGMTTAADRVRWPASA